MHSAFDNTAELQIPCGDDTELNRALSLPRCSQYLQAPNPNLLLSILSSGEAKFAPVTGLLAPTEELITTISFND
jgi:hypothetical protein